MPFSLSLIGFDFDISVPSSCPSNPHTRENILELNNMRFSYEKTLECDSLYLYCTHYAGKITK